MKVPGSADVRPRRTVKWSTAMTPAIFLRRSNGRERQESEPGIYQSSLKVLVIVEGDERVDSRGATRGKQAGSEANNYH
jgi:hypothetical protein